MPGKQRAVLLLLAVAVAIAAIIVIPSLGDPDEDAKPGDETSAPGDSSISAGQGERKRPAAKTISVRDGKPLGGAKRLSYEKGQTVNLIVTSNTADEVHVHGYDIERKLPARGRARLRFRANAEGVFDIELHRSGRQIAELRVNP